MHTQVMFDDVSGLCGGLCPLVFSCTFPSLLSIITDVTVHLINLHEFWIFSGGMHFRTLHGLPGCSLALIWRLIWPESIDFDHIRVLKPEKV